MCCHIAGRLFTSLCLITCLHVFSAGLVVTSCIFAIPFNILLILLLCPNALSIVDIGFNVLLTQFVTPSADVVMSFLHNSHSCL